MVLGLSMMVERPEKAGIVLKRLYAERPIKIWPLAPTILKFLPNTLDTNVSRYIQGKTYLILACNGVRVIQNGDSNMNCQWLETAMGGISLDRQLPRKKGCILLKTKQHRLAETYRCSNKSSANRQLN